MYRVYTILNKIYSEKLEILEECVQFENHRQQLIYMIFSAWFISTIFCQSENSQYDLDTSHTRPKYT